MKTSPIDYVLSTLMLSVMLAMSIAITRLSTPWIQKVFGDYYVLINLALVLLYFGVLAAVAIRIILFLRPIPPGTYDMDSNEFVLWKLITVIYHFGRAALKPLTPIFLMPLVATLYGAKIGKDVALGGIVDAPFMVEIDSRAVIGAFSLVSGNFTFGDKLIFGRVRIGAGATIGVNAVVYPNTEIGDNAMLLGGSYLMPGSRIPAGETWRGNPARKWTGGAL